jgi:ATP-binding cassette subfamily C protein
MLKKNILLILIKDKSFSFIFFTLFFLSIFLMALEVLSLIGLASIGSFLSNNENFFENILGFNYKFSLSSILIFVTAVVLVKNFFLIIYNYLQAKFSGILFFNQSKKLFAIFLNDYYLKSILKKPEELIRKISTDVLSSVDYIFIVLNLLKEFLVLLGIVLLLYFSNTYLVIIIFFIFGFVCLFFLKFFKNFLKKISDKFIIGQTKILYILNQSLGSLKENYIYKNNPTLIKNFNHHLFDIKNFYFYKNFIVSLPKIVFEIIALIAIMLITTLLYNSGNSQAELLNKISLLIVISLRLIPSFNIIASNFAVLKIYENFFNIIQSDLLFLKNKENNKKKRNIIKLKFNKSINFSNINFSYPSSKKILFKNSNLSIIKNKCIGISGSSGSGKTTLVDFILGLLKTDNSQIIINNNAYNSSFVFDNNLIGYVPQTPFLLNASIKKNIIFGRERYKISNKRILEVIKISKIYDFIKSLPLKENTIIGNNGSFLSGGQKQRLVIARALLLKPKILVLDEATNALDKITEEEIIRDIFKMRKDQTIIFITHNLKILKKCNIIYTVENGNVLRTK